MKRLVLLTLTAALALTSCGQSRKQALDRMLELEGYSEAEIVPNEKIRELRRSIAYYENDVERTVKDGRKLADYYRLTALEYLDEGMYALALRFFEKALGISPMSIGLLYRSGICAGMLAKSTGKVDLRAEYLEQAEWYYARALELTPDYAEALYALAVLYIFELDRSVDAQPLVETLIDQNPKHIKGLFLAARIQVEEEAWEEALTLYKRILELAEEDDDLDAAQRNIEAVMRRMR